jgi:hypothetical protein
VIGSQYGVTLDIQNQREGILKEYCIVSENECDYLVDLYPF